MPYYSTVRGRSAYCPIVKDREDGVATHPSAVSRHVLGSLIRPLALLQAREKRKRCEITGKSGPASGDTR